MCNSLTWEAKLSLSLDLRVDSSGGNERWGPQSRDENNIIIKQELSKEHGGSKSRTSTLIFHYEYLSVHHLSDVKNMVTHIYNGMG